MKIKLFLLGCGLGLGVATSGIAATTGTINATLTLSAGCLVNGGAALTNVDFGTLDFGNHVATFDELSATLQGTQGAGINVRCTDGATFNVQVTNSNAEPDNVFATASPTGDRYLILGSDANTGIAYTLYSTAAPTTPIVNNTDITPAGTPDPVNGTNYPIVGRIVGGGNSTAVPAGVYTDTIGVSVIY